MVQHQKQTVILKKYFLFTFKKMLNLSLNALKLIAKSRSIEGYKIMSEDRLLSAPNVSESVKMPDPANVN